MRPNAGIFDECRLPAHPGLLYAIAVEKIYGRPYFDVTSQMLDEMEKALANDIDPVTGKLQARFAHSVSELDAILSLPEPRPVAFIPAIEGGHCIDGKLENLQAFFERGVAYMTLAHFFANEIVTRFSRGQNRSRNLAAFKVSVTSAWV